MINFLKFRLLYLFISLTALVPGIYFLITSGLKPSIDFTGGTLAEYKFSSPLSSDQILASLKDSEFQLQSIEGQDSTFTLKFAPISPEKSVALKNNLLSLTGQIPTELRFETVGPTIGAELLQKTAIGLILATTLILGFLAFSFRNLKFGVCATLATLHDTLVILGLFAIFGKFWGVEVDALFVTALLTVLSFSVHDTIVVFDRIRENQKLLRGQSQENIINRALNETIVRSLNNSLTIIFMLSALLIFGGETIRWFVAALLIGTISGTYSSPFVATPLLLLWDKIFKKG